CLQTKNSPFTF
nr:immunoglobulin light chain junction region [Macaca mulatta]MOX24020.1 immunoglobulin light chain junction region [Macaca mulatta]MOX24131.1 immunoglobulin light chain junction region [Macaca mulatta]MOX24789.1 immunoglobulin light chain junction region [Macaca mulatta]MOX25554.1 immunoglobulin light chain junction region [Macaca mulatta]